jgi:hypothetical protein
VTLQNAYNAAIDLAKALGRRQPERYFTNPVAAAPGSAPAPDPLAGLKLQAAQADAAVKTQAALTARGQDIQAGIALEKARADAALKKYAIDQKAQADVAAAAIKAGA